MDGPAAKAAPRGSVAIRHVENADYPAFPYDPPRHYPEFSTWQDQTDPANHVYEAVRNILADMGLDRNNFDHPAWNPLREFIESGQRALIKPNWVFHVSPLDGSTESLITHTSLIRAVIDYLILALDQEGTIEIADAPLQGCDFNELLRRNSIFVKYPSILTANLRSSCFSVSSITRMPCSHSLSRK